MTRENNSPEIDHDVQPTFESMMSIIQESREASYTMEAGLFIGDTIIDAQVMEGAALEPLLEGFVGNVFTKMKEMWMKVWKKVKSWYQAIINKFKAMTLSGEKFVSEFGDTLRKKSKVGFKYSGYKWDFAKFENEIESVQERFQKEFSNLLGDFTNLASDAKTAEKWATDAKVDAKTISKDLEKAVTNGLGSLGKNLSEASEKLTKIAHGGDKGEQTEIENFAHVSVESLLEVVKTGKNTIASLDRDRKELDADFQEVINAINEASNSVSSSQQRAEGQSEKEYNDGIGKITAAMSAASSAMEKIRSYGNGFSALRSKLFEQHYKESQAILKKFLSYKAKPVKESAEFDTPEGAESVFEAAMNLV